MFEKRMKKFIVCAAGLFLILSLTACGEVGEYTAHATQLIQELDYTGALEALDVAEEKGENLRVINRSRGIAYIGMMDYENAINAFSACLAGSNGIPQDIDFDTNYYLAAAYTKSGRYEEAEKTYDAILALRDEEKEAYFLRGNVRMYLDKFPEAREDFDKVIKMDPENYDRMVAIYEILDYFGYRESGQEYLRAALESGEKLENDIIGRIYFYLGEYQKACLALEEARSKGDARSFLYLGKSYEATGDYNYAASVYNNYLSKYEGNALMYNQLGLCEMNKGEYTKALEAFQAGMQLGDSGMMQTLSFNEIVAYEHLGDFKHAYVLMGQYCKNYPDDETAAREYEFLMTR